MQFLPSLSPIANRFDAILLDLWGCLHDGSALYPGAHECLIELRKRDKKILMLSNAPRRAVKAQVVLDQLGVERHLYDGLLTSGEAGFAALAGDRVSGIRYQENLDSRFLIPDSYYFYIGPPKDADVLHGLPLSPTEQMEKAGFLLNVGFGSESHSMDEWDDVLARAAALKLPMLCLNPDMEVVKITGERFPCAGVLALAYEKLGGKVHYIGKPYPAVYEMALAKLGVPKERVLAIGDGLHTDVLGAQNARLASALVTGGVLKQQLGNATEAKLRKHLAAQDVHPDFVLPGLKW